MEAAFKEQYAAGAGTWGSLFELGGVQVNRDQRMAGYMFAFRVQGVDFSAKEFKQFRQGFLGGSGSFKRLTVNGKNVYLVTRGDTPVALMLLKGAFVIAFGPDTATARGIAKALVTANT